MLDFHSAVILASIEQTTLSATRRRKQSVGRGQSSPG